MRESTQCDEEGEKGQCDSGKIFAKDVQRLEVREGGSVHLHKCEVEGKKGGSTADELVGEQGRSGTNLGDFRRNGRLQLK